MPDAASSALHLSISSDKRLPPAVTTAGFIAAPAVVIAVAGPHDNRTRSDVDTDADRRADGHDGATGESSRGGDAKYE
jgi:hypothetical protein